MKLFYRGVSYEYDPQTRDHARSLAHVPVAQPHNLLYRGFTYAVDPSIESKKSPVSAIANLIYRGVTYSLNGWAAEKAKIRAVERPRGSILPKLAEIHRSNLYRNIDRRLQVAQEHGDTNLVHLLEQERQQIA
jgi:hypothetical protein